MRFFPRRRPRLPLPPRPIPTDPLNQALYAASQRGDELLRRALPKLVQDRVRYNRAVAAIIIGGTAAIFGLVWLFGDWMLDQFPAPPLFMR